MESIQNVMVSVQKRGIERKKNNLMAWWTELEIHLQGQENM